VESEVAPATDLLVIPAGVLLVGVLLVGFGRLPVAAAARIFARLPASTAAPTRVVSRLPVAASARVLLGGLPAASAA
jgi:hypothetical protein